MKARLFMSAVAITALTGYASAQSASVSMSAGSTTAAPGDTLTVTVTCDYDTLGASGGVFGNAGFYGFGGNVDVTGSASGDVTGSNGQIPASLSFGSTIDLTGSPELVRAAAGRGFLGGLADDPATMCTFDVTVDPGAADGTFTLGYAGSIVLVLDDSLTTFSTSPGLNQSTLTVTPLQITVSSSACVADVTTTGAGAGDPGYGVPDGQVTGADIQYYVNFWIANDLGVADVTTTGAGAGDPGFGVPDGQVTGADIQYFVNAWVGGCP